MDISDEGIRKIFESQEPGIRAAARTTITEQRGSYLHLRSPLSVCLQ